MRYPKRAYTFSVDYFSTPESVDPKIFVMKDGTVVAAGTHHWLLENSADYRALWEAQRSMYVGGGDHETA
ncbi:hypothetical protein PF626_09145 [Lacticaseibacillus rhamnosus]|uniref:hypothetical protein n=1 Tax=Lacticaseibacillus rhamnosus TaxID=47715 RepID=UPI0022EBF0A4|nr:hypothetical protein [Lacticaseibacillus rhamnosus]MDA3727103.1 hypothetical protein [Lacticaseibacillus rhamnosus]MDA3738006.1 hypothetical protein [Lacticaseibacillus rhamnosus]MDA3743399.1 hypothetical protein [Lacticaseibacillus rhamnosus]MDA3745998.1 hypothetical protein [Lacticaseibacillus rhamnosus]MDA3751452.1 hypothetical protein [Lacticaseibacillus rhamnosus]